jgi:DNA repair protein RadC
MKQLTDQVAEIELSYRPVAGRKPVIRNDLDAFTEIIDFFPQETIALQERFVVMYLNRGSRLLGVYHASSGGLTGTVVDVRLILGTALKLAASAIVLAHNHPSGNLSPSDADRHLTAKIREACAFMDIKLLEHLIISPDRQYYSMIEGF